MPILLDPARAPALDALLAAANTQGLDWRIETAPGATPPRIRGIGTLASAGPEEISFLTNPRYQSQLAGTRAAAVIVTPDAAQALADNPEAPACARVVCPHPYLLYARLAQRLDAARQPRLPARVHPLAVVAPEDRKSVVSGKSVSVRVAHGGSRIMKNKKNKIKWRNNN